MSTRVAGGASPLSFSTGRGPHTFVFGLAHVQRAAVSQARGLCDDARGHVGRCRRAGTAPPVRGWGPWRRCLLLSPLGRAIPPLTTPPLLQRTRRGHHLSVAAARAVCAAWHGYAARRPFVWPARLWQNAPCQGAGQWVRRPAALPPAARLQNDSRIADCPAVIVTFCLQMRRQLHLRQGPRASQQVCGRERAGGPTGVSSGADQQPVHCLLRRARRPLPPVRAEAGPLHVPVCLFSPIVLCTLSMPTTGETTRQARV